MLGDELGLLILKIPDGSEIYEMDFYTMQHPLQPHFWAILCSPKYGIQCLDRLKGIFDRSTRTVRHLGWFGNAPTNDFTEYKPSDSGC